MPEAVYRMMTLLSWLTGVLPVGTNLGLPHLLWMLVSGQLLATRGAVIPGLSARDLSERAVWRARAALGQGDWSSARLLAQWREMVAAKGHWQVHTHDGYHAVAVDVTAFWRPRLRACPTTHYRALACKAVPAIPVGLIVRVGSVGDQRLALPLGHVRADATDPRPGGQERLLVRVAVARRPADEALVLDAGFGVALLQEESACPNSPSSPWPSSPTSRPPSRPSRPASGTVAPSPRPVAFGVPSPACPFRGTSGSRPICAQRRPVRTIYPPVSGANRSAARPPSPCSA